MKKVLDRPALQLEALCPGLVKPGFCTPTHHRLGQASASPRPSPSFLGTGCGMLLESATLQGTLSHTHLGVEGGGVEMTHGSSLGSKGEGCEGAVGPRGGQGVHFLTRSQELCTLSVGREAEATFTERPLGPELSDISRRTAPTLVGIAETAEPGRSGTRLPQDSIRSQWTSWGGHFC